MMLYAIPQPRELPAWVQGQSPAHAMADQLRRHRQELAAAQDKAATAERRTRDLAEAVGLALWRKRQAPDSNQFRMLWQALAGAGVEFIDHVGEPVAGEVEQWAEILDWVDAADGIAPGCVAEAIEPEIRLNGVVAHRAKLLAVSEAPPAVQADAPPADDPSTPPSPTPPSGQAGRRSVSTGRAPFTRKTPHSRQRRRHR